MSRVVRAVPAARERQALLQAIAAALEALPAADAAERRDVVAFAALALERLAQSVEATAGAWERRGYWVKADHFRSDWAWLAPLRQELAACLARRDWSGAAVPLGKMQPHLGGITPSRKKAAKKPWDGAWDAWQARDLHRQEG